MYDGELRLSTGLQQRQQALLDDSFGTGLGVLQVVLIPHVEQHQGAPGAWNRPVEMGMRRVRLDPVHARINMPTMVTRAEADRFLSHDVYSTVSRRRIHDQGDNDFVLHNQNPRLPGCLLVNLGRYCCRFRLPVPGMEQEMKCRPHPSA